MRSGNTRSPRQHKGPRTIITVTIGLMLTATLTACEDHSPVAPPTSTLPAVAPTPTEPEPTAPEYETELDLSDEEKAAVDDALVAFAGYIETINRVFSSGGKDLKDSSKYAADASLESLNTSAENLKENHQYMAGVYDFYNVRIDAVNVASDTDDKNTVIILYCSNDSNHAVVDLGEPMPSQSPTSLMIRHTATRKGGAWKITNQELWSKTCD